MDSLFYKPKPVKQTKRNSNLKTLSFTVDQRTEVGLNDFAWRSIKSGNVFKTENHLSLFPTASNHDQFFYPKNKLK